MRICKKTSVIAISLIFPAAAIPETSIRMPEMPSIPQTNIIESPEMPKITAPSLGSGFYIPGTQQKSSSTTTVKSKSASTLSPSVNSEDSQTAAILNSPSALLSAAQMQGLQNAGFLSEDFTDGKSISQSSNLLQNLLNKITGTYINSSNNVSTDAVSSLSENTSAGTKNNLDQQTQPVASQPKILRFMINGQNILSSCKTIYFSTPGKDGSFLLTGDRSYVKNSSDFSETFYMLFTKDTKNISSFDYNVLSTITQQTKDEESPLFLLSDRKDLIAKKTGNLFYIKKSAGDWNMDLLIDLGTV